MESKAAKAAKVIFIISFIPGAAILPYAIYGIFFDVPILFGYESGLRAFCEVIVLYWFALCYIPVLPICLIYQIAYILRKKLPRFEKISRKKYLIGIAAVILVVIGIAAFPHLKYEVKDFSEKKAAQKMYYNDCDERIDFERNSQFIGGVMGIEEQQYQCIMVDHDRHMVGIIYGSPVEYAEINLKNSSENDRKIERIKSEYYVQTVIPLKNGRLISFYNNEINWHRTIAMLLEYDDGSVYYASELRDKDTGYDMFLGLGFSEYLLTGQKKYSDIAKE